MEQAAAGVGGSVTIETSDGQEVTGNGVTSVSLTKPTNLATDDYIIIMASVDNQAGTFDTISGFTKPLDWGKYGVGACMQWRKVDGTEGASFTIRLGGTSTDFCAVALRVTGVNTTSPFAAIDSAMQDMGTGGASVYTIAAIDTSGTSDSLAFAFWGFDGGDGLPFTVTSGGPSWALVDEIQVSTAPGTCSLGYCTKDMATAGSTGDVDITPSVTDGIMPAMFALAPT